MTRPVRPPALIGEVRGTRKSVESLAKRPAPVVEGAGVGPWIILTDGFVGTDSGTTYSVGWQYFGTDDVAENYYSVTARSATYPVYGLTDYYTVTVSQRGLYLLDAQLTIDSWSVTNGYAEFKLDPNKEAWYPFGFGTNEDAAWIERHVTHDATNGQVDSFFRINGIASLDTTTEFFPKFRQVTGTNNLVAAVNYFKIVRLMEYAPLANLRTGTVA